MFDSKTLDELTQRLSALLPPGARELQRDMEKSLRAAVGSAFARLDLVTREEFDIQKAVLERTRTRLATLERQVAALEARLGGSGPVAAGPGPSETGAGPASGTGGPATPRDATDALPGDALPGTP